MNRKISVVEDGGDDRKELRVSVQKCMKSGEAVKIQCLSFLLKINRHNLLFPGVVSARGSQALRGKTEEKINNFNAGSCRAI